MLNKDWQNYSYADLSSKVHESAFTLQTSMAHQYHVKSVAENL